MKKRQKILQHLSPPGTRRRSLFEKGIIGGNILFQDGPHGLYKKYLEFRSQKKKQHAYQAQWLESHTLKPEELEMRKEASAKLPYKPVFSIILPVYNSRDNWLRIAIDSVISQCYPFWELCIIDDSSSYPAVKKILEEYVEKDGRIKVLYLPKNVGVAGASNQGIYMAEGDFISLLDHDDLLSPDALYEMACHLNEFPDSDFVYSDELLVDPNGKPLLACYKPDFSIDYLLSHPYIVHLVAIRRDIVREVGGFRREFPITQDYDLFLRIVTRTRDITHIPKLLYHWRQHPASAGNTYMDRVSQLSRKTIKEFLIDKNIDAEVLDTKSFNYFRVKRKIKSNPLVSIIIPTRDRVEFLQTCVESILGKSTYDNYEIVIVDNMSQDKKTKDYLAGLSNKLQNIRILEYPEEFNFSRLNNFAARSASGEHLLLLNNDTKIITPGWIEALLEHSQREDVACVGAKLLYPDNTIQHAGVVIGLCGPAEHVYKFTRGDEIGYMGHIVSIRNYSAVTAACMMIQRKKFDSLDGFDEIFRTGFGDTDLCLRAGARGLLTVYTPYAELYHYESATRGKTYQGDSHPEDTARFRERWQFLLDRGDPFYNPNLPRDTLDIRPFVQFG